MILAIIVVEQSTTALIIKETPCVLSRICCAHIKVVVQLRQLSMNGQVNDPCQWCNDKVMCLIKIGISLWAQKILTRSSGVAHFFVLTGFEIRYKPSFWN